MNTQSQFWYEDVARMVILLEPHAKADAYPCRTQRCLLREHEYCNIMKVDALHIPPSSYGDTFERDAL